MINCCPRISETLRVSLNNYLKKGILLLYFMAYG